MMGGKCKSEIFLEFIKLHYGEEHRGMKKRRHGNGREWKNKGRKMKNRKALERKVEKMWKTVVEMGKVFWS